MDDLQTGPVSVSEGEAVVAQLRALAQRSAENRQTTFHFVFAMGAESLADNLEQVAGWDVDDGE